MSSKHRSTGTARIEPAVRVASTVHVHEDISPSIQILCDAMTEARINRARDRPPVFIAGTYESAELAMQLFSDYYTTVQGSPGPVGFDTETSSPFIPRKGTGVSLVQIATKDVCLIFQAYRITEQNTKPERFPPRLKAFLEDKDQILAGVAASGDATELRSSYGINCGGVVNLEKIAKEKKVLAASLADLDNMFGYPGREVVKTKAILKWNWDSPTLDPKWIWYAAKDAFAGQAIYENMMQGTFKIGHVPYAQLFPYSDEQETDEIATFLTRTLAKGKQTTMGTVESLISKQYPRFQKMYQPEERVDHSKRFTKLLVKNGILIVDQDNNTGASSHAPDSPLTHKQERNIPVSLAGKPFSAIAITPAGMAYLSKKFFRGRVVDLSAVMGKVGAAAQDPDGQGSSAELDQDQEDLRLFLRHATMWDRPHKLAALVSMYIGELTSEETQRIVQHEKMRRMSQLSISESGNTSTASNSVESGASAEDCPEPTPLERSQYPKAEVDRVKATTTWQKFINRMKHKGLLENDRHLVQLAPGVEQRMASLFEKGSMASPQPSQEGDLQSTSTPTSTSASSISKGNLESKKSISKRLSKMDKKRSPKPSSPTPSDGSSSFSGPSSPSSSMEHRKAYHSKPHHTIQPYPRPSFPEKKSRGSRSSPTSPASTPSPAAASSPTTSWTTKSPQMGSSEAL
ncbi:hypothetical protein BG006_008899 [Podila minutissima]|uniref:3'-5' exonuclease n=1 Tax=Podila minutissima TaxID=64525 RepID=A0A9P5VJA6_9FUNG|nr:hypothetical protein BG006_008899 [Podila minutissima]